MRESVGIARSQAIEELTNVIDINVERLIPLRDVPNRLPRRPSGKRVHWGTCYRWASRGLRGVHLESVTIGGVTYTSTEALQRFAEKLTSANAASREVTGIRSAARQKQIAQASARLAAILELAPAKPHAQA